MADERKFKRSDEQKRAEQTYCWIIRGLAAAGVALLFIHWVYSLCMAGFILWSSSFYERGRMEWVCDEYEQDGYPSQGLYRMFKSWKILAVLIVIVLIIWAIVNFSS